MLAHVVWPQVRGWRESRPSTLPHTIEVEVTAVCPPGGTGGSNAVLRGPLLSWLTSSKKGGEWREHCKRTQWAERGIDGLLWRGRVACVCARVRVCACARARACACMFVWVRAPGVKRTGKGLHESTTGRQGGAGKEQDTPLICEQFPNATNIQWPPSNPHFYPSIKHGNKGNASFSNLQLRVRRTVTLAMWFLPEAQSEDS